MRGTLSTLAVAGITAGACLFIAGTAMADDSAFSVVGPQSEDGGASVAKCPSGSHLIGGGYQGTPAFTNGGSPADFVDANGPSATQPNAWVASFHTWSVRAVALWNAISNTQTRHPPADRRGANGRGRSRPSGPPSTVSPPGLDWTPRGPRSRLHLSRNLPLLTLCI